MFDAARRGGVGHPVRARRGLGEAFTRPSKSLNWRSTKSVEDQLIAGSVDSTKVPWFPCPCSLQIWSTAGLGATPCPTPCPPEDPVPDPGSELLLQRRRRGGRGLCLVWPRTHCASWTSSPRPSPGIVTARLFELHSSIESPPHDARGVTTWFNRQCYSYSIVYPAPDQSATGTCRCHSVC